MEKPSTSGTSFTIIFDRKWFINYATMENVNITYNEYTGNFGLEFPSYKNYDDIKHPYYHRLGAPDKKVLADRYSIIIDTMEELTPAEIRMILNSFITNKRELEGIKRNILKLLKT